MATQLNFSDEGKNYTLEFTRETTTMTQNMGFQITKFADNINTQRELLFHGAFLAHHKDIKRKKTREMLYNLPDVSTRDELTELLLDMYADAVNTLDGSGNAKWQVMTKSSTPKN